MSSDGYFRQGSQANVGGTVAVEHVCRTVFAVETGRVVLSCSHRQDHATQDRKAWDGAIRCQRVLIVPGETCGCGVVDKGSSEW